MSLCSVRRRLHDRSAGRRELRARPWQRAYDEEIQARLDGTVWNQGGCRSWHLDDHGRNTTLWPTYTWRFRQRTRRFDPESYLRIRT